MSKESHRQGVRRWKERNREKVRKQTREYYLRNREKILAKHTARRRAAGAEEPIYRRRLYYLRKYGITLERREQMLVEQLHQCAICAEKFGDGSHDIHLDHCHETGKVRALLCQGCNKGIGAMRDDPVVVQKAADYLKRWFASQESMMI